MEAFARSSSTLFAKANPNKPPTPLKTLLGRFDICFLRFQNSNLHVHHTFLLRHKALQSVAPSQTEVLTTSETTGIGVQSTESSKTIHVQFQLHKECKFGETFLLVGNEPIMGHWNPSSAIPLNWSDGNIWSAEMYIPIDRTIQFKFILKNRKGDLVWQPGPDRILHTWDTCNTITIYEDWKNAELQKIIEGLAISHNEVPLANRGMAPTVSRNMTHPEELMLNVNKGARFTDKIGSADDKSTFSSNNEALLTNPGMAPIAPMNVTHAGEELMRSMNKGATFSDKIGSVHDESTFSSNNEFIFEEKAIQSPDGTILGASKEDCISDDGVCYITDSVRKTESISKTTPTTLRSKIPATPVQGLECEDEDEDTLLTYEECLVSVPGLTPIQGVYSEEAVSTEHGKSITTDVSIRIDATTEEHNS